MFSVQAAVVILLAICLAGALLRPDGSWRSALRFVANLVGAGLIALFLLTIAGVITLGVMQKVADWRDNQRLLDRYGELVPSIMPGGKLLRTARRYGDFSSCAADVYDIGGLPQPDYSGLPSGDRAHLDMTVQRWEMRVFVRAPIDLDVQPYWSDNDTCVTASDRQTLSRLIKDANNVVFVERLRRGFGNWDTGPQTYTQYLVVIDRRNGLLYASFWDRGQGG